MNFFEHQDRARRKTYHLVVLFVLAVIAIVLGINLTVGALMGILETDPRMHLDVYVPVTLLTLLLIGGAAMVRIIRLRGGGDVVARAMGAEFVPPDTRDLQLQRLRNVVEEIALASGVPVPQVYVLEQESGINAFAAGYSPADAAVAVTRGALETLNRDELQGVIAHEFSHILNGDMRLNIRLMGVLFGILVISVIGRLLMHSGRHARRSRDKGQAAIMLFGLALLLLGYIGVFFGRLIKAGVSRQREYLADAAAIQFTRQPQGLAGALKKIGGMSRGSRLQAADTEEVSHMLFASGVSAFTTLLATHPPLVRRIQAIEPDFTPEQLKTGHPPATRAAKTPVAGLDSEATASHRHFWEALAGKPLSPDSPHISEKRLTQSLTGDLQAPDREALHQAAHLMETLPAPLYQAALSDRDVIPLLLALLLYTSPALQQEWQMRLAPRLSPPFARRVEELAQATTQLNPMQRLPLVELTLPALRQQPPEKRQLLITTVDQLIHQRQHIGVFGYALGRLLTQYMHDITTPHRQRLEGRRRPADCRPALTDIFAVIAFWGHTDATAARHAFTAGMRCLFPDNPPDYQPPQDWVSMMDAALPQLEHLNMPGRKLLVEGLVVSMSHDGRITVDEAELLRIICSYLHIPAPPILAEGV